MAFKDGGRFAVECRGEFIRHGIPERVVAVLVGDGVIIFLHVFVDAEDSGWDDGCDVLVFHRAIDHVFEFGNDGILDIGDVEMGG